MWHFSLNIYFKIKLLFIESNIMQVHMRSIDSLISLKCKHILSSFELNLMQVHAIV